MNVGCGVETAHATSSPAHTAQLAGNSPPRAPFSHPPPSSSVRYNLFPCLQKAKNIQSLSSAKTEEPNTPPKSTNQAMPPKRKSPVATAAPPAMPPRMTRSMADGKRGLDVPAKKEEAEAAPAAAVKKVRKKAKKEEDTVLSPPAAKQMVKKNAKKEVVAAAVEGDGAGVENGKRVIVEACTQCQQFKKRALKVKEDLESAVPGVSVTINPAKPRRGCLEIREEGGEVFISLLNMPRPFKKMRELDMDKVIKDIAKKIS